MLEEPPKELRPAAPRLSSGATTHPTQQRRPQHLGARSLSTVIDGRRGNRARRACRFGCGCALRSPWSSVLAVVQSMACAAENDEVGFELGTDALVGVVVHLEALGVRSVERAAMAGPGERCFARPAPLRRSEVLAMRHRTKLQQPVGIDALDRRIWRLRRGSAQPPDAPTGVLDKTVTLEIGERP